MGILNIITFNGFRIESPWFILFLIPAAVAVFLYFYNKKPTVSIPWIKTFSLKKSQKNKFNRTHIPALFFIIGIIFMIIALSRPQYGIEELIQKANGIDIMLAVDLSGSMKAIDIPNDLNENQIRKQLQSGELTERMNYSKKEIIKFIEKRPDDRIGLVVFAPKAYPSCPPTLDHSMLISMLKNIQAGMVGDATNIAAPIATAVNKLKDLSTKRKVIVLFTDGANNVTDRISPLKAAELAKKFNIVIYTVGIGTENALVIQDSIFGTQYIPVAGQFDQKLMKEIADATGGKYYKADDSNGLKDVLSQIDKLEKTEVEQPRYIDYKELAIPFILLSLILIGVGFILENSIFKRLP